MLKLFKIYGFDIVLFDNVMTWDEAGTLPEGASQAAVGEILDWVHPDVQTLRALSLLCKLEPSFTGLPICWSATQEGRRSITALRVSFSQGLISSDYKNCKHNVLLVRESQCMGINIAGAIESMRQAGIEVTL